MLSLSRIRLATAIAMILVGPTCLFGQSVKPELIDWPVWRLDSRLASDGGRRRPASALEAGNSYSRRQRLGA